MASTTAFESRVAQIDKSIDREVATIRAREPLSLTDRGSPIVNDYVQKIEGVYNVGRAKADTANAIDLLYIAYNTTPQEERDVRVKIAAIMDKMIKAQGDSAIIMAEVMRVSDNILRDMDTVLSDWKGAKDSNDAGDIKAFVVGGLLELANDIRARSTGLQLKLLAIADTYERIIDETALASDVSEQALGSRLEAQQVIKDEINEANAGREQLDALVQDLRNEVQTFETKARQYELRAITAEERAFVMQIVKMDAQVIAAALPPLAMAAGAAGLGGVSVIAALTVGAFSQATWPKGDAGKTAAQGLGELSQEQKNEVVSLRQIQMKMLDKAEAYERGRREQSDKQVKIDALLKGERSKEETIALAVKSLGLSVGALKRTKEIVQEIAFLFQSFADFMGQVVEEVKIEIALVDNVASRSTPAKNRVEHLVQSTDEFFIRQSGEWRAVHIVSDMFNRCFADGRSKLNRLSGSYITGDELSAYLQGAAILLEKIVADREAATQARLVDLDHYRRQVRDEAIGEEASA